VLDEKAVDDNGTGHRRRTKGSFINDAPNASAAILMDDID